MERKSKGLPRPYCMDKKKTKAKHGQLKGVHSRGHRLKNDAYTLRTRQLDWLVLGVRTDFCLGNFQPPNCFCYQLCLFKPKHTCKERFIL